MIIPDKKKIATMIVAHLKPDSMAEGGEVDGDPYVAIADEILSAIKAGSASDLADALKAFDAQCEADEMEEGEESEY